jgi:glycosyltransferase involved in cell wall biosynthesis
MATCNGAPFIRQQLASILGQLGPEDELIISDDSSTDATIGIVREFADSRIRILEGNTFASPCRNFEHALKPATGEIIVLADQDDIWLDNKLAMVRSTLASKVGRVALIMMDGYLIDADGVKSGPRLFEAVKVGPGVLRNIYDNCYVGSSLAFTRELLALSLPFPPNIPMHDMWLGILAEIFGEVEFVTEPTYLYRRHGGSNTDLRRRFQPVAQIRRRYYLAVTLLKRYRDVTRGRHGAAPDSAGPACS